MWSCLLIAVYTSLYMATSRCIASSVPCCICTCPHQPLMRRHAVLRPPRGDRGVVFRLAEFEDLIAQRAAPAGLDEGACDRLDGQVAILVGCTISAAERIDARSGLQPCDQTSRVLTPCSGL